MTILETNFMSMSSHVALLMKKISKRINQDEQKGLTGGIPVPFPTAPIAPVSNKMVYWY